MKLRWPRAFMLLLWCGSVLMAGGATASAQSVSSVEDGLSRVRSTMENLRTAYLQPIELQRSYDLASRMTEARMRFLYGDYDGASILFLDIAENRSYEQQPGYWEAVYLLGESLFARRTYTLARAYYQRALEHGTPEVGMNSARRLLEIAFVLREFDGLDAMYATLERRAGGRSTPELSYIRGKSLYFQGRFDVASNAFASIPAESELALQGLYFQAVCDVRLGRLDDAIRRFEGVIERSEGARAGADAFAIRELAFLGIARVHYEQGRHDLAERAYLRVGGQSERYDAALYELAWTRVQLGELSTAIRQLEILEIVGRNHQLRPEASLLRGDLLLRDGQHDSARDQFDAVALRYESVERELDALLAASGTDPMRYYERYSHAAGDIRLPSLVRPWFESSEGARRSSGIVLDLRAAENDLADCEMILEELEAALANPVLLYGRWREGWGNAVRAEVLLLDTWEELVRVMAAQSEPRWDAGTRQEYASLRRETAALRAQVVSRPRSFEEMNADVNVRTRAVSEQRLELLRAQQELAQSIDEIESVRRLLARSGRPAAEHADFEARIAATEENLLRQRAEAEQLQRRYQAAVAGIGVGDRQSEDDALARRAYRQALRAEVQWLAERGGGVDSRIGRLESDISHLAGEIDQFFAELGGWVHEQTAGLRTQVQAERVRVDQLARAARAEEQAGAPVIGALTQDGLAGVRDRFHRITLRANLGGIDVAWRGKEVASDDRRDLLREQVRALRALEMDFAEIREDQ
jgi:tetratricopeptide (TPR) repeat protein